MYHRHVDWVDLPPPQTMTATLPPAYVAEIAALQNGSVDAVYVRGPAGLAAARSNDASVLIDISAHRDPWLQVHTALLSVVTVSETLLREHPDVVARELLEHWPALPARLSLDEVALSALDTLKAFMARWAFIRGDFTLRSWAEHQLPGRGAASLVV
jgi:ABC-type nitrate/sulfonate/bicarbonate transport system substrate-binding protein